MSTIPEAMDIDLVCGMDEERVAIAALGFVLEYLSDDKETLAKVSAINKAMLDKVRTSDWLWRDHVPSFPCHDVIQFPNTGSTAEWNCWIREVSFPKRLHGPSSNIESYEVHPRDRIARRHKETLVLIDSGWYCKRLNPDSGVLEDLFRSSTKRNSDDIWLPREFPCDCTACRVTLQSQEELFLHCATFAHLDKSRETPIPDEFVDPRHNQGFEKLTVFRQARELRLYEDKVMALLMAPLIEPQSISGIFRRKMEGLLASVVRFLHDIYEEENVEELFLTAVSNFSLNRLIEHCMEVVVTEFKETGLDSRHVEDVIVRGNYDNFDPLYGDTFLEICQLVVMDVFPSQPFDFVAFDTYMFILLQHYLAQSFSLHHE